MDTDRTHEPVQSPDILQSLYHSPGENHTLKLLALSTSYMILGIILGLWDLFKSISLIVNNSNNDLPYK